MDVNQAPLLTQLRDIKMPDELIYWSLAPGWWLLLFIALSLVSLIALYVYRRGRLRRLALSEVESLHACYVDDGDAAALTMGLTILLKRLALVRARRGEVAGVHSEAWLRYLDQTGATDRFTRGAGRVLVTAPYGGREPLEEHALMELVKEWIRMNT